MRLSKLLSTLALSLLLPLFGPYSGALAQPQTDSHLTEAQRLFKAGQSSAALGKADAHIASKPREPQGRFLKGLILADLKRTAEAIAVFKKLTEDFPELPEPYNNLAVLYAQEKQYDRARQALEAAIKTHPSYSVAHENLGDVYSKLASQAYGKALQIDSNNPAAQNKLALIGDLISVAARQSPRSNDTAKSTSDGPSAPVTMAAGNKADAPAQAPAAMPLATAVPVPPPAKAVAVAATVTPSQKLPQPATTPAASTDDAAKAVHAWAAAWSKKDVKTYIAAYTSDYASPGASRKTWEAERAIRLTKPGSIQVDVDELKISFQGKDKAVAKFRQHYKSANLKSSATKTLTLLRHNDRWLIDEERVN